jgi:hypothetical protein
VFGRSTNSLQTSAFSSPAGALRRRESSDEVSADADALTDWPDKKDLQMQAFSRAADGIRTHDLLHGKQNLRR